MSHSLLVGFEGPSLAGKTTSIGAIRQDLMLCKIPVLIIDEYTGYAGGHANLPPVIPASRAEARYTVDYFLALERQRKADIDAWLNGLSTDSAAVVLVDRLITSCMRLAAVVGDKAGYRRYVGAIKAGNVITPHCVFLMTLPDSEAELTRRRATRTGYRDSHLVYGTDLYSDAVGAFCTMLHATLIRVDAARLDRVRDYIWRVLFPAAESDLTQS